MLSERYSFQAAWAGYNGALMSRNLIGGYSLHSGSREVVWRVIEEYPRSLREFQKQLATEQAYRDYLFHLCWPEGFRCMPCPRRHYWRRPKSHKPLRTALRGYCSEITTPAGVFTAPTIAESGTSPVPAPAGIVRLI